jgi:hypothetical protein
VTPPAAADGPPFLVRTADRTYFVERSGKVGRYVAAFPMVTVAQRIAKPGAYVRLWLGAESEVLRTDTELFEHAQEAVHVSPRAFGGRTLGEDAEVIWQEATPQEWDRHRAGTDRSLRAAKLGLGLVALGTGIDLLFTAGELVPDPWLVSPAAALALKALKSAALVAGGVVAYRKAVVDGGK